MTSRPLFILVFICFELSMFIRTLHYQKPSKNGRLEIGERQSCPPGQNGKNVYRQQVKARGKQEHCVIFSSTRTTKSKKKRVTFLFSLKWSWLSVASQDAPHDDVGQVVRCREDSVAWNSGSFFDSLDPVPVVVHGQGNLPRRKTPRHISLAG